VDRNTLEPMQRKWLAMDKAPPPDDFDENPEWTAGTQARSRLASEVLPAEVAVMLVRDGARAPRPAAHPSEKP